MQALAARQRMQPTENFDFRSMFEFQRTMIGNTTNTKSVRVENVAVDRFVSTALNTRVRDTPTRLIRHKSIKAS